MAAQMSKKQNILFVCSAIATIVISIVLTLVFTGNLDLRFSSNEQGYQNITLTDASISCENTARNEFGKRLKNLFIDNHSSRYEHAHFTYKIFLQIEATNKANKSTLHYINCYINASNGKMTKFEIYENKDAPKSSVNTGPEKLFNWPR